MVLDESDGLDFPRDLDFAPDTGMLWVVNLTDEACVIVSDPGTDEQTSEVRQDRRHEHFMGEVSGIAFGVDNFFATSQESGGNPQPGFMGPTLWSADLDIFAVMGQDPDGELNGSHMDMLHVSPLSMGIAHERDNVYWVFDGKAGDLVRYDFVEDHGPGMSDHTDGIIRRFVGTDVTRVPQVVGHLVYDERSDLLYVADTGGGRITVLDTTTGTNTGPLPGNMDNCQEYSGVTGAEYSTLASDFGEPSGIALLDGMLFVSDHASNEIIALDLNGDELGRIETPAEAIMGIAIGPENKLWYVDAAANQVVRVDP
ncbi:MAG: hypothetical protein B7733_16950 [Myxococcales bacterium FL481]|nr:MAG: hypothetical protein B7733_16950 [Myxococcales bacterium FL481]